MRKRRIQGEGNYDAARDYDRHLRRHVESSDIEAEARRAAPRNEAEAAELARAEAKGKRRRKEEDPALRPEHSHAGARGGEREEQ
ncbi:MAG: hypothetical protein KJ025_04085 [Burkholderiales bacterium]|nr:hypothetical protein [Burkholderiales bacterium]